MGAIWKTCRRCQATFLVEGPGRYECPGCGRAYLFARTRRAAGEAPAQGKPPPPAPQGPVASDARPAAVGAAARPRYALPVIAGLLALAAAGIIFLLGPFDGGAREAARWERDQVRRDLDQVLGRNDELAAKRRQLDESEAESRERAERRREEVRTLLAQKAQLQALDARLALLEQARASLLAEVREAAVPPPRPEPDPSSRAAARQAAGGNPLLLAEKAVVVIRTEGNAGSGFIVDRSGLVATSYHVVEGAFEVKVEMQAGASADKVEIPGAAVVAVDAQNDLALLRLGAAPEAAAMDDGYPSLPLRRDRPLRLGETVYVLGSPGLGDRLLEYTLTRGVISSPRREIDGVPYIQTSAPINPGNSGGPLLDADGAVAGVVTLKGINVEAVGFAVPAEALAAFLEKREQLPYAVGDGLEEWEKRYRPITALVRRDASYRGEFAVPLDEPVDAMLLDPPHALYLLARGSTRLRKFDLSTRKVESEFRSDSAIAAMDLDAAAGALLLAAHDQVLRVDKRSMKLKDAIPSPWPCARLASADDAGLICAIHPERAPVLIPRSGREQVAELLQDRSAFVCRAHRGWLCILRLQERLELVAYRVSELKKFQALSKLREEARRRGFPIDLVTQVNALEKEALSGRLVYSIDRQAAAEEGIPSDIVFLGPIRVILGRRILQLGKEPTVEARFAPGPYVTDERPEMKKRRDYFRSMDNFFSASLDGRYAASGTHIYDIRALKPIRKLPFPSRVHVFSRDGASLYLYDSHRRSLYLLEDWQKNAGMLQEDSGGK